MVVIVLGAFLLRSREVEVVGHLDGLWGGVLNFNLMQVEPELMLETSGDGAGLTQVLVCHIRMTVSTVPYLDKKPATRTRRTLLTE